MSAKLESSANMEHNNFLQYFIDEKADVLYFTKGKPSTEDISKEITNGIIGRFDPNTKKLKGFTVLNFSQRAETELPISVDFSFVK